VLEFKRHSNFFPGPAAAGEHIEKISTLAGWIVEGSGPGGSVAAGVLDGRWSWLNPFAEESPPPVEGEHGAELVEQNPGPDGSGGGLALRSFESL